MPTKRVECLLFLIIVPLVWSVPINHDIERGPLAAVTDLTSAVSELNSRVATRASRLQQNEKDPRFPLPAPQDLDTIKKVAQILIMLGEQVIPSIIGEPPSCPPASCTPPPQDIPNDTVNAKSK